MYEDTHLQQGPKISDAWSPKWPHPLESIWHQLPMG